MASLTINPISHFAFVRGHQFDGLSLWGKCISGLDTFLWSEIVQVEEYSRYNLGVNIGYIKIYSIPSTSAWGKLGRSWAPCCTVVAGCQVCPRGGRWPPPPAARCAWPAHFQASSPLSPHMGAIHPRILPPGGGKQSPAADTPPRLP